MLMINERRSAAGYLADAHKELDQNI